MIANPPGNSLGIQRRMVELGRIRLGDKGTKGQPQKLTKFRLTSASRPLLEAAARMYGGTVRAWQGAPDDGFWELYTETDALDIMIPPVITAYSQLYEIWDAGGCTLRCNGEWESIADEACSHDHENGLNPEGKPWSVKTRVSVILPKLPGLGTWRLETNGWNAAATLPAALDLLMSAGRTGWLPAILRLEQRSSKKKVAGANGQLRSQTFRYVVPIVDIIGFTFAELFAAGGGDVAAIGDGSVVPQQLPVGPSRPPRGTKVDRPALGPAPALPAVSGFRKPEAPPAPVRPPAPPAMVSGWEVAAPESAPAAPEAKVIEAVVTTEVVGRDFEAIEGFTVDGETSSNLVSKLQEIAGASDLKGAMTDSQRARLRDVIPILGGAASFRPVVIAAFGEQAYGAPSAAQAQAIVAIADSFEDLEDFAAAWSAAAAVPA